MATDGAVPHDRPLEDSTGDDTLLEGAVPYAPVTQAWTRKSSGEIPSPVVQQMGSFARAVWSRAGSGGKNLAGAAPTGRRYAWAAGGKLLTSVLSFAAILVFARSLGLAGYGTYVHYVLLFSAASMMWNVTTLEGVAGRLVSGASICSWHRHIRSSAGVGFVAALVIGTWLFGIVPASLIGLAVIVEALYVMPMPRYLAEGLQRVIAARQVIEQAARLSLALALWWMGELTPATALYAHLGGYFAGMLIRPQLAPVDGKRGSPMTSLRSALATDALKWAERYLPILGAALLLGASATASFDLLLRALNVAGSMLQALGAVVLPSMVVATDLQSRIHRALRLPTAAAMLAWLVFGVFAGEALRLTTGDQAGLGLIPLLLAAGLVLNPFLGVSRALLASSPVTGTPLIQSQALSASFSLLAAVAMGAEPVLAAALVSAGTLASSWPLHKGLRELNAPLLWRKVLSLTGLLRDVRNVIRMYR